MVIQFILVSLRFTYQETIRCFRLVSDILATQFSKYFILHLLLPVTNYCLIWNDHKSILSKNVCKNPIEEQFLFKK